MQHQVVISGEQFTTVLTLEPFVSLSVCGPLVSVKIAGAGEDAAAGGTSGFTILIAGIGHRGSC